jgi:glutathione S-transferase
MSETETPEQPKRLKLIGSLLSPYTRRVAVSLNALDQPYELEVVSVITEQDKVRAYNPVIRIPVVLMPDGEVLIESYAILDEIDQRVGPERALIPQSGDSRRVVMQTTALALACMEKAQWAFYEGRFRPENKVYEPWVRHNDNQVVGGLRFLNTLAAKLKSRDWLAGTSRISQADITTTVVCSCINVTRPRLDLANEFPELMKFTSRCEDLAIFKKSPPPVPPLPPAPVLPTAAPRS